MDLKEPITQLIVQFRIHGHGSIRDLDFRHQVEDELRAALQEHDLGMVDGGTSAAAASMSSPSSTPTAGRPLGPLFAPSSSTWSCCSEQSWPGKSKTVSPKSCGPSTTARSSTFGKSRTTIWHEWLPMNCRAAFGSLPTRLGSPWTSLAYR